MIRRISAVLAAALTLALAASSVATPGLTNASPSEGTVGTQITITGAELGTKAPKAVLRLHGDATAKPLPLKLAKPFDGTTLHAVVVRIAPGDYDLVVTPKGGAAITLSGAFTARAPQVASLSAATLAPGDSVDILGRFFGTTKGKVVVGGIAAKVTFWSDAKITAVVSKKNKASAAAAVDVIGKGGTQNAGATAAIVAPIAGKDHFTVKFDGGGGTLSETAEADLKATSGANQFDFTVSRLSGLVGTRLFSFEILVLSHLDVGTYMPPTTIGVNYLVVSPTSTGYSNVNAAPWTVNVTQIVGGRVAGNFSGGLKKNSAALPGPDTYAVTGDFVLTIK